MILVLAPETAQETVQQISRSAEDLGWKVDVSRSSEQVVLALEGTGEPDALERALSGFEVDVIPILSSREYLLQRSRRSLMTGLATGLGLLAAASAGLPVVGFLLPPRRTLADPDVVSAGSIGRLEEGAARSVSFHGLAVLLICLGPGRYVALSAICTHMNICKLDWDAGRRLLVCGCHGGAFDVHGNVVRGPASVPLPTYSVERVGDELFVRRS
jgi:Rieske Fe-S protein